MKQTTEHPDIEVLRSFHSLRYLTSTQLTRLANSLNIETAPARTQLIKRGSDDNDILYLLNGALRLISADGGITEIHGHDESARNPISQLRPRKYDVYALTKVNFLHIDNNMLKDLVEFDEQPPDLQGYEVSGGLEGESIDLENELTYKLYQDLTHDRLILPTLPEVATKITNKVNQKL